MEGRESIEIPDAFERLKLVRSSNKSAVWKHFGFIERGGSLVKCIHCETTLKYSNNTTNFRSHLRSRHRDIFDVMIASEGNTAGFSNAGRSGVEHAVGTILYEILPSELSYSPENAPVCDNEKEASVNEPTTVLIEGISSALAVSQESALKASASYEKTDADEPENDIGEAISFKDGRMNRKRKNTAVDLATIAKLMKDYLEYQKESDRLFLNMERQWQEREERLRKEDREHSLYMLKLLLAKKQDK